MSNYQQNPDGSWAEAQPLGWQGHALDFEVRRLVAGGWEACGWDEDVLLEVLTAYTRWGLGRKMRRAAKRHGMKATVLR